MVYYIPDGSTWRDDGDEAIKGTPTLRIHVTNKCSWNICVSRRKKKRRLKIENLSKCWDIPVVHHGDIFPFFSCILSRMRE